MLCTSQGCANAVAEELAHERRKNDADPDRQIQTQYSPALAPNFRPLQGHHKACAERYHIRFYFDLTEKNTRIYIIYHKRK